MKYNAEQCCEFIRAVEAGKKVMAVSDTGMICGIAGLYNLFGYLHTEAWELRIAPEPVVTEHWELSPKKYDGVSRYVTLETAKACASGLSEPYTLTHVVTTRTEVL